MRPPAVFLLLLLWGCDGPTERDFDLAWSCYHPVHVAGIDPLPSK
jgi:hypothetical protein